MKFPLSSKRTPPGHLAGHLDSVQADVDPVFMVLMATAGGLTRKDFQYGMRVSKTLVKEWFEGRKHDPLRRARDVVALFREGKGVSCIPAILEYIAGSNFDGAILTADEQAALMVLAKRAVKKPAEE